MATILEMPLTSSYYPLTPLDAKRLLEQGPRFGDVRHINAHKFLQLFELAARCTELEGFCLCRNGCYDRRQHWVSKPDGWKLRRMNREELLEVVERLRCLGYATKEEIAEVCFWNEGC